MKKLLIAGAVATAFMTTAAFANSKAQCAEAVGLSAKNVCLKLVEITNSIKGLEAAVSKVMYEQDNAKRPSADDVTNEVDVASDFSEFVGSSNILNSMRFLSVNGGFEVTLGASAGSTLSGQTIALYPVSPEQGGDTLYDADDSGDKDHMITNWHCFSDIATTTLTSAGVASSAEPAEFTSLACKAADDYSANDYPTNND